MLDESDCESEFLPPASEGCGKVIFSVCLSVRILGGGYPSPKFFPRCLVPGLFWGIPQTWLGVPQDRGVPLAGTGVPPWPGLQIGLVPPPPRRGGQVMLWAVCLVWFPAGGLYCFFYHCIYSILMPQWSSKGLLLFTFALAHSCWVKKT